MKSFKQELDQDLGLPFEFPIQDEMKESNMFVTSNVLGASVHLWVGAGLKNRYIENEVTIFALLQLVNGEITLYDAMKSRDTKVKVIEFDIQKGFSDGIYVDIDSLDPDDRRYLEKKISSPESRKDIENLYLKHFLGQTIF